MCDQRVDEHTASIILSPVGPHPEWPLSEFKPNIQNLETHKNVQQFTLALSFAFLGDFSPRSSLEEPYLPPPANAKGGKVL